ncbi:MAG TPA: RlmE family RNA methyltransferase [Rhodopila sp.]|jgi:23S rRNA (uridine2552-2'-O)-methyltransferase
MAKSPVMPRSRGLWVPVKTAKSRTPASARWLARQLNDPYVAAARQQGWRSRAAFKLLELDDKFHLIRKGARVIDLGAAPGGWSQVAVKRGASVLAMDLLPIDPIPGVSTLQGDFTDPDMPRRLTAELGGRADLVLSDMAPNTTGHASTDHIRIVALAELALDFAIHILAPGGAFVAKVFQGGSEKPILDLMKRKFVNVRHAKPPSSRKESSELYVVVTGFRGHSGEA